MLNQAVQEDKLVLGCSIPVQFACLLVEPFRHITNHDFKRVIVLNGLDECFDRKQQVKILQLFMEAIQTNHLPIRLMLCSRPEPQPRTVLESEGTTPLYRSLALTADRSAYKDIRKYLVAEFPRISSKFSRLGVHLGEAWPDENALNRRVEKSSGIFIYASTVIRFIDDEYSHPADRLASVLALEPDSTAHLDALYTEILSPSIGPYTASPYACLASSTMVPTLAGASRRSRLDLWID
ncbi:hypothetical protein C8J57DRAFT_1255261 [Mycena rebaudengoi]|nr:hypothetical protein C8J57DRAFT_1255261 [Mycena rebaudengoi]